MLKVIRTELEHNRRIGKNNLKWQGPDFNKNYRSRFSNYYFKLWTHDSSWDLFKEGWIVYCFNGSITKISGYYANKCRASSPEDIENGMRICEEIYYKICIGEIKITGLEIHLI